MPTTSPSFVTSRDPTFASTMRFTASKTVASPSISRTSWPFSSRISDSWFMACLLGVTGGYRLTAGLRYLRPHAPRRPDRGARRRLSRPRRGLARRFASRVSLPDPTRARLPALADGRQHVARGLPGDPLAAPCAEDDVLGVRPPGAHGRDRHERECGPATPAGLSPALRAALSDSRHE